MADYPRQINTWRSSDIQYIQRFRDQILAYSEAVGVAPEAIAGGVIREFSGTDQGQWLDPKSFGIHLFHEPAAWFSRLSTLYDDWETRTVAPAGTLPNLDGGAFTNDGVSRLLADANLTLLRNGGDSSVSEKLSNPILWDDGSGHIKVSTALNAITDYLDRFRDTPNDPLDLKQYDGNLQRVLPDLRDPNNPLTFKVAALVAQDGVDFFKSTMGEDRWNALSSTDQAAALTQFYVRGREVMFEKDFLARPAGQDYTPDLSRPGSSQYLFPGNEQALLQVLYGTYDGLMNGPEFRAAPGIALVAPTSATTGPLAEVIAGSQLGADTPVGKLLAESSRGADPGLPALLQDFNVRSGWTFNRSGLSPESPNSGAINAPFDLTADPTVGSGAMLAQMQAQADMLRSLQSYESGLPTDYSNFDNSGYGYDYSSGYDSWPVDPNTPPIILDLGGHGLNITQLGDSQTFVNTDASAPGTASRTAWAGAGNGVLVYNADDATSVATMSARDYQFTAWDPTATTDVQALIDVFDTNHDGKIDASDANFALFCVAVTNADGTSSLVSLASLGITSISLTQNAEHTGFADGSSIDGTLSFTRADGSTGLAASVTFANNGANALITTTKTVNADGSTTLKTTTFGADGSATGALITTTNAAGTVRTIATDATSNGIITATETIATATDAAGNTTETRANYRGADPTRAAALQNRTVTSTSADGKTVTTSIDATGGGFFDSVKTDVTAADGSRTVTMSLLHKDGSLAQRTATAVSADGGSIHRISSIKSRRAARDPDTLTLAAA